MGLFDDYIKHTGGRTHLPITHLLYVLIATNAYTMHADIFMSCTVFSRCPSNRVLLWSFLTQHTFVRLDRQCANFSLSGNISLLIQLIIFGMTSIYTPIDTYTAGQLAIQHHECKQICVVKGMVWHPDTHTHTRARARMHARKHTSLNLLQRCGSFDRFGLCDCAVSNVYNIFQATVFLLPLDVMFRH
jgi:hypothetical protein